MCKRMIVLILGCGLLSLSLLMAQEEPLSALEIVEEGAPSESQEMASKAETSKEDAFLATKNEKVAPVTKTEEAFEEVAVENPSIEKSAPSVETSSTPSPDGSSESKGVEEPLEAAEEKELGESKEVAHDEKTSKDEAVSSAQNEKTDEALTEVTPATKPENASEENAAAESSDQTVATPVETSSAETSVEDNEIKESAVEEQEVSTEKSKAEELVGIDTINVDEPAGNWLYKRLYWERGEDKYQKIKELMMIIFDTRTKFFDQREKMDDEIFDPLYKSASFSRGELSGVLSRMLEDIDKQHSSKENLDDNSRVLFAKIEANKERLEEVKKEIEFVSKIDKAVDEAITTLIGLLNQARNFEMQAWSDFKAISRELSDKKARDLFYRIDTYWRNIKDIEVYITTKLSEHMNYLASSAQQHADTVQGLLKDLEAEGFVLKEQVDELEKTKTTKPLNADQDNEAEIKAKEKKGGFFAFIKMIFSGIAKPFVAIAKALWHTITIPFGYFFGDTKPEQLEQVPAVPEVALEGDVAQKQALPEAP